MKTDLGDDRKRAIPSNRQSRNWISIWCTGAIVVGTSCLVAMSANATLMQEVQVSITSAAFPTCEEFLGSGEQSLSVSGCSIPALSGFENVTGSASSHGTYGRLGTRAEMQGSNSDGRNYLAFGGSSYTDRMVINAPGLQGTLGSVDFFFSAHSSIQNEDFNLTGGPLVTMSDIQIELNASTFGLSQLNRQVRFLDMPDIEGPVVFPLPPPVELVARLTIRYGEPFELKVGLESQVRCFSCGGSWSGIASAINTLDLELIAAGGVDPPVISVQSLDGNSYANVVPEPSTGLLLLAGLAVLAAKGRDENRVRHR